jgi:cytochrome c biogenesis protein CcdA
MIAVPAGRFGVRRDGMLFPMTSSLTLALFSCALLGFRHGFDYDHIAAITDITSAQVGAGSGHSTAKAMFLGLMYALGHAVTVAVLGCVVIVLQLTLPRGIDRWAERLVGLTLIVLAVYVLGTLASPGKRAAPSSRAALMIQAFRWGRHRLMNWRGGSTLPLTARNFEIHGPAAFGVGVIHGFGAETPSQLALFLMAANLGGRAKGFVGLALFLVGLLMMNTLMTASAAGLFSSTRRHPRWMPILSGVTALYSLGIGVLFLVGSADLLPSLSN